MGTITTTEIATLSNLSLRRVAQILKEEGIQSVRCGRSYTITTEEYNKVKPRLAKSLANKLATEQTVEAEFVNDADQMPTGLVLRSTPGVLTTRIGTVDSLNLSATSHQLAIRQTLNSLTTNLDTYGGNTDQLTQALATQAINNGTLNGVTLASIEIEAMLKAREQVMKDFVNSRTQPTD